MKQNLLEMTLVFLAFYLPGIVFGSGSLETAGGSPAAYMGQAVLVAVPQVGLFLYLMWLRERARELQPQGRQPAGPPPMAESPPCTGGVLGSRGASRSAANAFARYGLVRWSPRDLLDGVLVFAGAAMVLVLAGLVMSLLPDGSRRFLDEGFRFRLGDWRLAPLALVFGVAIGYREELFFRGYLLVRFSELGVPAAAAVAASSILFALGHLYQGPAGFLTALALGGYFGVLFTRKRNLHRLALAHGLYNTAVLIASLWSGAV
jgi:membrane protease YdiL (CAAX protease family)